MGKIILYLLFCTSIFAESNLQWQKEDANLLLTYDEAVKYCDKLTLNNKNDWRLATLVELTDLSQEINFIKSDKPYYVWSSTEYKHFKKTAWFVSFSDYYQHFSIKTNHMHVKCVREIN